MFEQVETIVDEFNAAQKAFKDKMKGSFEDIFKEYFAICPEVDGVGWTQWSPYFNDGEPCTFRRHDIYAVKLDGSLNEDDEEFELRPGDLEEYPWDYNKPSGYVYDSWTKYLAMEPEQQKRHSYYASYGVQIARYEEARKDPNFDRIAETTARLMEVLEKIPEDIYESTFGDGVAVLFTKNGMQIDEDVDHD